jgi:hypothetical protein
MAKTVIKLATAEALIVLALLVLHAPVAAERLGAFEWSAFARPTEETGVLLRPVRFFGGIACFKLLEPVPLREL